MGYLGEKIRQVQKLGVKAAGTVAKFGEKHKGKLAIVGVAGAAAVNHSNYQNKHQPHPQGGRVTPYTPYHQDKGSPYSFPVEAPKTKPKPKPFKVHAGVKGNIEILYGKREPHAKSHQVVRPPPAPKFGKSKGYSKQVGRLPGPTQQGRAEADLRTARRMAKNTRLLAEADIKRQQKQKQDKTLKGKYKNKKDNAKMLYQLGKAVTR
jgi:hypothetical protein